MAGTTTHPIITTTITTTTTTTTSTSITSHTLSANTTTHISIANTTILSSVTNTTIVTSLATTVGSSGVNQTAMAGNTSMSNSTTTTTTAIGTTTAGSIYQCSSDYIGTYCNMSSDACAMSDPCLNDATCYPNKTFPYDYYCACQLGYIGYNCEYDERSCQENTCW
jgi:hypothetical protein